MADDRTIGRLSYGDEHFWTVEKPWKDNEPFVSCIPAGNYTMVRRDSPRFGPRTWEVSDVPGRTHILLHVGNTANDVVGCISLGTHLHSTAEGVSSSRKAMKQFHALTDELDELELEIVEGVLTDEGVDSVVTDNVQEANRDTEMAGKLADT